MIYFFIVPVAILLLMFIAAVISVEMKKHIEDDYDR
jgi:hypothetical protein